MAGSSPDPERDKTVKAALGPRPSPMQNLNSRLKHLGKTIEVMAGSSPGQERIEL